MAGFELASSRGGSSIWEVLQAAGFEGKTAMKDFRAKMDKLGIPNDIGQKNSQALKWLNKNSKLKYVPLSDELLEVEKSMGIHGSSKADKYFKRPERRIALSQRLSKIQEWAHEKFGKKTTMPKLESIVNKLKDIPLIAKKGTDFLMKLGFRMTLGPSMIGADLMTEEAAGPIAEILSDKKEPLTYRGGGMADINTMTAPLGYAAGGPIPKDSGGLQPPTGLSKWYADKFPVDPIHQMKENLIDTGKRTVKGIGKGLGELFGGRGAGAGEALDELISKRAMLIGQINGEMMFGDDETLKNLMNEYKRLDNMIRTIQLQTFTVE